MTRSPVLRPSSTRPASTRPASTRPASTRQASTRRLLPAALASFGSATLVGATALAGGADPLTDPSRVPLALLVPGPLLIVTAVIASLAGTLTATTALVTSSRTRSRRPRRLLVGVAVVEIVVFGFALQGLSALSTAGYLMAFCLPAALAVLTIQVVRRYPVRRWPVLAALLAALVAGVLAGPLQPAALNRLMLDLGAGVVTAGPVIAHAVVFMTTAIVWAGVVLAEVGGSAPARRLTELAVRHRRVITIVAAAGPLPYALVRFTWLTPWPLAAPEAGQLSADIRLWGLLIGGAAAVGVVLTLGLIRPWGERFPRWVPGLAHRPVPVAAAAVPGGIVAALVSAAAAPMVIGLTAAPSPDGIGAKLTLAERLGCLILFPFWIWGPALALAVWGYAGHRAATGAGPAVDVHPRTPVDA